MSKLWLLHLIPNARIEYELLDNQITLFPTVDSDFVYVNPFHLIILSVFLMPVTTYLKVMRICLSL